MRFLDYPDPEKTTGVFGVLVAMTSRFYYLLQGSLCVSRVESAKSKSRVEAKCRVRRFDTTHQDRRSLCLVPKTQDEAPDTLESCMLWLSLFVPTHGPCIRHESREESHINPSSLLVLVLGGMGPTRCTSLMDRALAGRAT